MQLCDLTKPMEQMSDEELLAKLRQVRANRMTIRPAAKAHAKKEEKKGASGRISTVEKLMAGMTPAQRAALIASLGEKK